MQKKVSYSKKIPKSNLIIMKDKIIEFSSSLRAAGIPVSIRSTKTAYKSAFLIDNDMDVLKEALACVYVKELEQKGAKP